MGKFYDYLSGSDHINQSGGAVLRVTGDRNIPLMDSFLALRDRHPEILDGLVEVIALEDEPLHFKEVRPLRPPYMKALRDISQFLRDNSYEAASTFLTQGFEQDVEKTFIVPTVNKIYVNRNGKKYRCTGNLSYPCEEKKRRSVEMGRHIAYMERVKDKWTFFAHGVIQYADGTIDWNYSTNGRFPF